jgi:hypothetical protein
VYTPLCRFPTQLVLRLKNDTANSYNLKIIAQTGWTTTNLLSEITSQSTATYDFVSLLMGVNNHTNESIFCVRKEFELVAKSIALAGGDKSKVIVVSVLTMLHHWVKILAKQQEFRQK